MRLLLPRNGHSATVLASGRIALVGGARPIDAERKDRCDFEDPCSLAAAEIFDPRALSSTAIASLAAPRQAHAAVATAAGLAVVGGILSGGACVRILSSAELWDAASNTWRSGPPLDAGLAPSATRLADGRLLIAGGLGSAEVERAAHVWDPVGGRALEASTLNCARYLHGAARLLDGRVLVSGGLATTSTGSLVAIASAEIFDPITATWSVAASMAHPRCEHTLTVLGDGSVLAIGGYGDEERFLDGAERWDPASDRWLDAGRTAAPRCAHTATLALDGRVIVAGGLGGWIGSNAPALDSVEAFDSAKNVFERAPPLAARRAAHSALLLEARLLFLGGDDGATRLDTVETWTL